MMLAGSFCYFLKENISYHCPLFGFSDYSRAIQNHGIEFVYDLTSTMGQSTSKGLREAAKKIGQSVMVDPYKPVPSSSPGLQPPSHPSPVSLPTPPTPPVSTVTAANPGNFLRGDGIAKEDVRDVGQEMYLQHVQQQTLSQQHPNPTEEQQQQQQTTEMSEDLLRFIQNVGPAKQSIDRDFTAPRLLQEENIDELQKAERFRKSVRQRRKMPLMGQDQRFMTEKNTNFSFSYDDDSTRNTAATTNTKSKTDFGLDNHQLYQLLVQKESDTSKSMKELAQTFVVRELPGQEQECTEAGIPSPLQLLLLQQTLEYIEIPTLRMDSDGNILGLYSKDVPGPEVKSVTIIPETKVMLVLKDLAQHNNSMNDAADGRTAANRLIERRKDRKTRSVM
jgi:hypothetical protein